MSFDPLLEASPAIRYHAFAAIFAFALGIVQFAAPKGTVPHRALGWLWVVLMAGVSLSSFFIHTIRLGVRGVQSISCRFSRRSCWCSGSGMRIVTTCAAIGGR
jgi:uncharacterized membrane protein